MTTMAQKEGTADANAIICLDGDDRVESIIGRQYSDHPQYHDLVVALNGKKFSKLVEKKVVLKMFRMSEIDDVQGYCRDQELWKDYGRHLFESIRVNTTTDSQINKLTTPFVAKSLADLFVLNEWNSQLVDNRHSSRSDPSLKTKKAFATLKTFADTVLKKYQEDQLKAQAKKKSSRSKANHQATGTRVQDTVPFNPNNMDSEGCPKCKHFYCQPVVTPEEVKVAQKELDDRFDRKMAEWIASSKGGGKPRRQKSVAMEVACYCCISFCGYRDDGGNCPACIAATTAGQSNVFIGGDGKPHCRCEVCNCKCQIKLGVHERRLVALEVEREKWYRTSSSAEPPTDTASYFDNIVRETVQQATIDAMQEPSFEDDPTSVCQNAFSLATMELLSNTHLQSNMPLRNTMTQAIPRTTMTSTGYSIPEMRRRHRLGLDITPATKSATATVTPKSAVASTGAGREKRFYRNGLSPHPLVPPTSVASRPVQSEVSTLDDSSSDEVQCVGVKSEFPMDDRKRKADGRPPIIKRVRKKANRTLRQELKKGKCFFFS